MRVLHVTSGWPSEENPGQGVFIQEQVASLENEGVDCEVLRVNARRTRFSYLEAALRLPRLVRRGRFDLLHAHYGLCGILVAPLRSVPSVVSFLGDDVLGTPGPDGRPTRWSRLVAHAGRRAAARARAVIVKSQRMAVALGLPGVRVVPNGVDLARFRPLDRDECRRELGLPCEQTLVLFSGDPRVPVKRFELAEAAVDRARRAGAKLELLPMLRVPRPRVPLLLNAADCLLLTSHHEGSPNTVKEALACGLPVVSVDVGDVAERLRGVSRSYVTPPDADALATALLAVLGSPGRSNGPEHVRDLDLGSIARRIRSIYEDVLRNGR
ncbi:MAG: glycosyltransferase [Planctomycetes bacterium]|nr:glycosyltransferase [Planctomycetota bacterium]